MSRPKYDQAPAWVPAPPCRHNWTYELMLLHMPDEDIWSVATHDEVVAIQDQGSFTGLLLRDNAALLALQYLTNN